MFIFKNTISALTLEGFQMLIFENKKHNLEDLLLKADSKLGFGLCFANKFLSLIIWQQSFKVTLISR